MKRSLSTPHSACPLAGSARRIGSPDRLAGSARRFHRRVGAVRNFSVFQVRSSCLRVFPGIVFDSNFSLPKIAPGDFETDFLLPENASEVFDTLFGRSQTAPGGFDADFWPPKTSPEPFDSDFLLPEMSPEGFDSKFLPQKNAPEHSERDFLAQKTALEGIEGIYFEQITTKTQVWSARTCPRFGTGRHVSQSESGDMSPHSKNPAAFADFPPNS